MEKLCKKPAAFFSGKHDDVIEFGDMCRTLHLVVKRPPRGHRGRVRRRRLEGHQTFDRRLCRNLRERRSSRFRDVIVVFVVQQPAEVAGEVSHENTAVNETS